MSRNTLLLLLLVLAIPFTVTLALHEQTLLQRAQEGIVVPPPPIRACVKKDAFINNLLNTPNIRIVAANVNCTSNEIAFNWNIPGVRGLPGPKGDKGDKGDMGATRVTVRTKTYPNIPEVPNSMTISCNTGEKAIGGGFHMTGNNSSQGTVSRPIPATNGAIPTGWEVKIDPTLYQYGTPEDRPTAEVYAVCAAQQ